MIATALSIAGSDSGGGAGIQADLRTFHAFGVFGTTAITALTAQNTRGVLGVEAVSPEFVRKQIDAVAQDLAPAACKSGMLANRRIIEAVADAIAHHSLPNYVLDPVMVASSGDRLLDKGAEKALLERLIPLAVVVTPNLREAEVLTGLEVRDESGMVRAAEALVERGAAAALVKGGHLEGGTVVDMLWDGRDMRSWRRSRVETTSTHGTGCTLSAAIAAGLANGESLVAAVEAALNFVHRAIATAPSLGSGHGPLNHWAPTSEPTPTIPTG